MPDLTSLLGTLIRELTDYIEHRGTSERSADRDGGMLAPDSIEVDSPDLYEAVKNVEACFPGSKLPLGGWEYWHTLLRVSRQTGDDSRRCHDAVVAALLSH